VCNESFLLTAQGDSTNESGESDKLLSWHLKCEPHCSAVSAPLDTPLLPSMHPNTTSHFFTVDVEEYFQVRALESAVSREEWISRPSRLAGSIDDLLQRLDRYGARGTFFVLGWIAEHRPEIVHAIAAAGHEIASHGFWHERVTALDRDAFREDVRSSKQTLEDLIGIEIVGYRAPSFSIIPGWEWAFDVLIEEGYRYDSSLFPIRRRGYGYPNSPRIAHVIQRAGGRLAEFPLATTSILRYPIPAAGGGYLRQFPLAIIRRAFREATERDEPATFYIHPWEIDPDQPRLPVSALNRLRHYRGLAGTLGRIDDLLEEFSFDAIASYLPALEGGTTRLTAGAA
jgi:polysaccharide deacetylase family protein (PEP-CTERM system associated)